MTSITNSRLAFRLFSQLGQLEVEEFWVLALHSNRRVMGRECVFRGTVDACPVYPRDVFRSACRLNAAALIVAHNHPSGEIWPSSDDIAITKRLCQAGELLGIPVLDHLIVAGRQFYSFADRGWSSPLIDQHPVAADP